MRRYEISGGSGAILFMVSEASRICLCSRWIWWRLGAWGQKVLMNGILFWFFEVGVLLRRVFLSRECTLVIIGARVFLV